MLRTNLARRQRQRSLLHARTPLPEADACFCKLNPGLPSLAHSHRDRAESQLLLLLCICSPPRLTQASSKALKPSVQHHRALMEIQRCI